MNRYDYYTRCVNFDEQEWLTEELYYPEPEEYSGCDQYEPSYSQEYIEDYDDYYFCSPYDEEDDEDGADDKNRNEYEEDDQDSNGQDEDHSTTAIQAGQNKGESA
ncbi:MAG: hypothetical protein HFI38_07160 [Lachnospiraceae bacterium]|nr:hypothetical protein [Lachnospiraceae bacterium]